MLCDHRVLIKLKGKIYETVIRLVIPYDTRCWNIKNQHMHNMSVIEMRMLRWISGNTKKYRIQNEELCL